MKTHQREAARQLFLQGWTLARISRVLDASERTVIRWKNAGSWEQKRTEYGVHRETAEESVWDLINYQLKILEMKTEAWKREKEPKLIDKGDIDALQKLFMVVKRKEQAWTEYVSIMREFVEYLAATDHVTAKALVDPVDEFLNEKRREL